MSFLRSEDRMILMNSNAEMGGYGLKFTSMDTPDLKRVRDECGVTVAEEQVYWHDVEKTRGQYDWSLPDRQVDRVLKAGLRLILCTPISVPKCLPKEWYWMEKGKRSNQFSHLSFWHADAQNYQRAFIEKIIERYSGDDVHVIFHGFLGGESVMWNSPGFFDVAAIADFKARYGADEMPVVGLPKDAFPLSPETREWLSDAVVRHHVFMQEAFMKQHNEVWDDLQPNIAKQSEANGGFAQYAIHEAYKEKWPDVEQWLLMYTYWSNGPQSAGEIDRLITDFGCKVIVEANYCEGLPRTTELAIAKGFHGQIVCPLHPFRAHTSMEPWMYGVIKEACDLWKTC